MNLEKEKLSMCCFKKKHISEHSKSKIIKLSIICNYSKKKKWMQNLFWYSEKYKIKMLRLKQQILLYRVIYTIISYIFEHDV